MRHARVVWPLIAVSFFSPSLSAQARVDRNVVYGMYSGLALLMDVHHPADPNGYGLILIRGSGWHAPPGYGAGQLKGNGVPRKEIGRPSVVQGDNKSNTRRDHHPCLFH